MRWAVVISGGLGERRGMRVVTHVPRRTSVPTPHAGRRSTAAHTRTIPTVCCSYMLASTPPLVANTQHLLHPHPHLPPPFSSPSSPLDSVRFLRCCPPPAPLPLSQPPRQRPGSSRSCSLLPSYTCSPRSRGTPLLLLFLFLDVLYQGRAPRGRSFPGTAGAAAVGGAGGRDGRSLPHRDGHHGQQPFTALPLLLILLFFFPSSLLLLLGEFCPSPRLPELARLGVAVPSAVFAGFGAAAVSAASAAPLLVDVAAADSGLPLVLLLLLFLLVVLIRAASALHPVQRFTVRASLQLPHVQRQRRRTRVRPCRAPV